VWLDWAGRAGEKLKMRSGRAAEGVTLFIITTQDEFLLCTEVMYFQIVAGEIKFSDRAGRFFLAPGLASIVLSWYSEQVAAIEGRECYAR
jgi:hypothetical protein